MKVVYNPPPGWPAPPPGWLPPAGWEPPSHWPSPPAGWVFYLELPAGSDVTAPAAPRQPADPAYSPGRARRGLGSLPEEPQDPFGLDEVEPGRRPTRLAVRLVLLGMVALLLVHALVMPRLAQQAAMIGERSLECRKAVVAELVGTKYRTTLDQVVIDSVAQDAGALMMTGRTGPATDRLRVFTCIVSPAGQVSVLF